MNGETIKSFLVGLGFGVDDASLAKFNKAISSATVRVTALYASINLTATAIAKGISGISDSFEKMGYEYKILAPAINKALILRQEMLKAYSAAGINLTKVIQSSVKFNMSLTKTRYALEAIYKSVGSRFFVMLTKQSDLFRQKIYQNMPKIQNTLEKFIKFIFKALEATTILGARLWSILTRVYDFFVKLDKATEGWSTIILGVIAAWKLLNLSFLATPLGMLLAGFLALLALWDDFKTFKEGGKSLIDWGSDTAKIMVGLATAIAAVAAAVGAVILVMKAYAAVQAAVNAVMLLNPFGLILASIVAITAALGALIYKWDEFKKGGLIGAFKSIGEDVMNFFGGSPNVESNLKNNPVGASLPNPVGSNVQNSNTNQNVNQQTMINIQGSADANSVGKAVAGEQSRVNFDMVRNMKGATR